MCYSKSLAYGLLLYLVEMEYQTKDIKEYEQELDILTNDFPWLTV